MKRKFQRTLIHTNDKGRFIYRWNLGDEEKIIRAIYADENLIEEREEIVGNMGSMEIIAMIQGNPKDGIEMFTGKE